MTRWKWIGFGLLIAAAVGTAGYFGFRSNQPDAPDLGELAPETVPVERGDVQLAISAPGQMVETQNQLLHMQVEGQLEEVLVQPGDEVEEGQVLARIGGVETFEAVEAAAWLALLQAQQELDDLIANAPKDTADAQLALLEAEKALKKAQTKVESLKYPRASQERLDAVYNDYQAALQEVAEAQNSFNNYINLPDYDDRRISALNRLTQAQTLRDQELATYNYLSGKPTETDVKQADIELERAQAAFDIAQRSWERVQNGPDAMKLDLAKAKVADLEAKHNAAEADLENLELKAPFSGVVTQVDARAGDRVTLNTPILSLTNPQALEAEVTVVEEDWPLIEAGQTALLYLDASTTADLTGEVTRVVPMRVSNDRPVYPVYIQPDNLPDGIAPGMTVDASIIIDARQDVLTLPKAVLRIRGDGTAEVEVWKNGATEERQVTVGLVGDQNVEILDGLEEGELVVGR
jgi:HlyD family secretion protein